MKLHLHVKSCYFAEIKAGTKTEEYREQIRYWKSRLYDGIEPRKYEAVVIYNAYLPGPENRIEFPWRGFEPLAICHPHFGSNRVAYVYAIKLQP